MAYNPSQPSRPEMIDKNSCLLPASFATPWLLYAYPWMPFPRRVIIYLREKGIPESLVKVVRVQDPGRAQGNQNVDDDIPPKPFGSLPILAIPTTNASTSEERFTYIRQSNAIMYFLEELCDGCELGLSSLNGSLMGKDAFTRARINEVMSLAEECTVAWNPVRTFGTAAGSMSMPEASKEMLRWIRRSLATIERFFEDRDMAGLRDGSRGHVNMADIVLFQFLEFVDDCYGVDLTLGSGNMVKDVYGGDVKEEFPKLAEFYRVFKTRPSAKRNADKGEVAPADYAKNMSAWADGIL